MTTHPAKGAPVREASKLGQFSWALFDWANQPFFTVITTFIFAPVLRQRHGRRSGEGAGRPGLSPQSTSGMIDRAARARSSAPWPTPAAGASPTSSFFQCLVAVGCVAPVVGLSPPARPRVADQLGGGGGHGRRGDVDRVQQRLAAQHRAARAHGLAERLRLGPGLLRRPGGAVRRAGRQPAVDVRPARPTTSRCSASIRRPTRLERLVGPASAVWLALFVIPMFLFHARRRPAAAPVARRGRRSAASAGLCCTPC